LRQLLFILVYQHVVMAQSHFLSRALLLGPLHVLPLFIGLDLPGVPGRRLLPKIETSREILNYIPHLVLLLEFRLLLLLMGLRTENRSQITHLLGRVEHLRRLLLVVVLLGRHHPRMLLIVGVLSSRIHLSGLLEWLWWILIYLRHSRVLLVVVAI